VIEGRYAVLGVRFLLIFFYTSVFFKVKTLLNRKGDFMTFDDFWEIYPRKQAKKDARKAWDQIKMDESLFNQITTNIELRLSGGSWNDKKYIPLPATYLRGERWEDEVYSPQSAKSLEPWSNLNDRSWASGLVEGIE
jgi:hypothetical protein